MTGGCIYALSDPRTPGEIRYFGKTTQPIGRRLAEHIGVARIRNTHRDAWIRTLLAAGLRPMITILETGLMSKDALDSAERAWIARGRADGLRLCNLTGGGDGLWHPSPEVRARIAAAHKGRKASEETRMRISVAHRGLVRTAEHCANLARVALGRRHTPETCRRISEVQRGQKRKPLSLETRARISAAKRGKPRRTRQHEE